jgi:hypothetical protein
MLSSVELEFALSNLDKGRGFSGQGLPKIWLSSQLFLVRIEIWGD